MVRKRVAVKELAAYLVLAANATKIMVADEHLVEVVVMLLVAVVMARAVVLKVEVAAAKLEVAVAASRVVLRMEARATGEAARRVGPREDEDEKTERVQVVGVDMVARMGVGMGVRAAAPERVWG